MSKIQGSAPGYVGYEDANVLDRIRRKPYSVVLFDEIEKAHSDIFNLFLQMLDEGRLTDGQGRTINFQNCIVIMTSNIGAHRILEAPPHERDHTKLKNAVMEELLQFMRPELLNRIDETVIFNALSETVIEKIVSIHVAKLNARLLSQQHMQLEVTPQLISRIAQEGWDINFGARPLKRSLQEKIEIPLSIELLNGKFNEGDIIFAHENENQEVVFTKK
jgi:ATP-dependent Clp protease ATP-binding subunit ClpB